MSESAYAVTEIETVPQYKSSTENMYIEDNNHIYPDKMIDEQMMVISTTKIINITCLSCFSVSRTCSQLRQTLFYPDFSLFLLSFLHIKSSYYLLNSKNNANVIPAKKARYE